MKESPIETQQDLVETLQGIIRRAQQGKLDSRIINALCSALESVIAVEGELAEEQRRENQRISSQGEGTLIHDKGRLPVEVVDISARGFGLVSSQAVAENSGARLEISVPGQAGVDLFSCYVVYCRKESGRDACQGSCRTSFGRTPQGDSSTSALSSGYRIGLRTIARLPRM